MGESQASNSEAILGLIKTILAILGGLFGGVPHIFNWVSKPSVKIQNCRIFRDVGGPRAIRDEFGEIVDAEYDDPSVSISWDLKNELRVFVFGHELLNVRVIWNLERVDAHPRVRPQIFSGTSSELLIIPRDQEVSQRVYLPVMYLNDGHYVFTGIIESAGKKVGHHREVIIVGKKQTKK